MNVFRNILLVLLLKLQNLFYLCYRCNFLVEVEALKHAPTWGLKHRRDSISGLSTHSQPMNFAFGTHSPALTYNSGFYLNPQYALPEFSLIEF